MKKCKVCGDDTEVGFNIKFTLTPVCEECATAIFIQQASSYAHNRTIFTTVSMKRPAKKSYKKETVEVVNYLNERLGKKKRYITDDIPDSFVGFISKRIEEGHTLDKVKAVVWFKSREWKGDKTMQKFLRPATLFNKEKFNNYVFQLPEKINPDNTPRMRELISELTKFGMRGTCNEETDEMAKALQALGYDNKGLLNMYLIEKI